MKTFIVYLNGVKAGYVKAQNHNAAEKKARNKHGTVNHDEVELFMRLHPHLSRQQALDALIRQQCDISVAYTEL